MFDCFLAQLLALTMIFFCSSRFFFIKDARLDSFVVFAPLSFAISILILFCFDFSVFSFAIFVLSLLVFFTNFRAVLRLSDKLIVDNYSAIFIIFSIIELILTILLLAALIFFRPVKYSEKDFGVTKTQYSLTGAASNLQIREKYLKGGRFSGNLFVYEPEVNDEITAEIYSENPVLLFVSGIRAGVKDYEPYLMLLSQKGYKVLAADLYAPDFNLLSPKFENKFIKELVESKFLRKFAAISYEKEKPAEFEKIIAAEKTLATKKYSALTKLALEFLGDDKKFIYIVDNVDFDSIYAVIDKFNTEPYSNAKGFVSMNRVDEYKTSGYGFIEQTDVLLAHQKGIERENKFFIARYVANKTIKAITEK
ncbi:hypothetical protein [uncultured Treponema sp.]|uniref:hypothetical protein n=1 Tax=uncultured Treponema sp. TaxID=162155 RepID=UPI0025F8E11B|nr:hypothetical protein [uncultured Treponema sp.]